MATIRTFTTKLYLAQFFCFFIPFSHYYSLFLKYKDMTPFQISLIIVAVPIGNFLFGIPSSVIADRYSRKNVIAWGLIILAISFTSLLFFQGFIPFLISFFIIGAGISLYSGTYEALIYDELKHYGKEATYQRIFGMSEISRSVGASVAGFIGSWLVTFGYETLIIAQVTTTLLAAFMYFMIKEVRQQGDISNDKPYHVLLKEGLNYGLKVKELLVLIIFMAFLMTLESVALGYSSIIANDVGWHTSVIGVLIGITSLFNGIVKYLASRSKISISKTLIVFLGALIIFLVGMVSYSNPTPIMVSVLINSIMFSKIVISSKQQTLIPSSIRATVTSLSDFLYQLIFLTLSLAIGMMAESYNYQTTFVAMGFLSLLFVSVLWLCNRRIQQSKDS